MDVVDYLRSVIKIVQAESPDLLELECKIVMNKREFSHSQMFKFIQDALETNDAAYIRGYNKGVESCQDTN